MIGVSIEEKDSHFLPHAGQSNVAEFMTCAGRQHPQPGRTILVKLAQPVPMKLYLHPPEFVGVNLRPSRTNDDGRLNSRIRMRHAVEVPTRPPADVLARANDGVFVG